MSYRTIAQPLLGGLSTLICIPVSLFICSLFDAETFGSWVAFTVICTTPMHMVLSLVWHYDYPLWLSRLGQPTKGLVSLLILALSALVVAPLGLHVAGGGITPPSPFSLMYVILSVVTTLWLLVQFQCWPLAGWVRHPAATGLGTLLLAYSLAWGLFQHAFDFQELQNAPFYIAELDPHGGFDAWDALSFAVTTAALIMAWVLFDFWPLRSIAQRWPLLNRQPLFGLLAGSLVLVWTGLIWYIGVNVLQLDVVEYLVRVPVPLLFGEFIILLLFQNRLLHSIPQPLRGIGLAAISTVLAAMTQGLYARAGAWITGGLSAGGPLYQLELWLASAMLAVTFPVMVAYSGGFAFWPFQRR
ncbi:hypothetical protein [Marinobacterium aestuariivivens]|uniref:Uncharacterized protein n=1 Tax=Marinobacterium aestuariivivens TaxID=1698799 RepID=A0ABW2A661_9GAMM